MSDTTRIEQLEEAVRRLFAEVEALRRELRPRASFLPAEGGSGARIEAPTARPTARPTAPASLKPSPQAPPPLSIPLPSAASRAEARNDMDMESLVGRYGTVALAAVTIVMGLGAFLTWAIAHVELGPRARVALGALAAVALAVAGARLRTKGEQRFGNILLGLSLALVHVVVWGAGPYLGLIAPTTGLVIAAAASLALAALALRTDEETLFIVGGGGALLAPFVTTEGGGDPVLFLAYGLIVLGSGMYTLRGRDWSTGSGLVLLGATIYTLTALVALGEATSWMRQAAPAMFALGCAWSALVLTGTSHRRRLLRPFLGLALLSLMPIALDSSSTEAVVALAALVTLTAGLALRLSNGWGTGSAVLTTLIPIGALAAALISVPGADLSSVGAGVALAWSIVAAAAAWSDARERRGQHLMSASLESAAAIGLALHARPVACIAALGAHAAVVSLLMKRERSSEILVAVVVSLAVATGWSYVLLEARPPYRYEPFLTLASLAALTTSAAWGAFGALAARTRFVGGAPMTRTRRRLLAVLGVAAAFLWIREELARAFSADMAVFLLILYYALAGVAAIFLGRRYRRTEVRQLGLGLAVYAAVKALVQASAFAAVGLKVGSFFVVGGFLLAVAYWYRASIRDAGTVPAQ